MPRSREPASRRGRPGLGAAWLPGLGLLLLPVAVIAQAADEEPPASVEYSSPYAAWDAGAYDQALRGFADHQTERPDDPELSLNVGAAHYKLNDFEAADGEFYRTAAIGDDELRAEALYNLGNSAYRQDKLEDAVDFYMASLEANPDDLDAKFNLEFVREEMRRRQQQNQDNQNTQQNEQQQEEQEDQGAQQQPEGDQGQDEQPPDQEQDPGNQGQDQQPEGGEGPQDSDGDGIPDAEEPAPQDEGPESGNQGRPPESPPGMTPEEAERYLQALEEGRPDPTRRGQRGRRSRLAKDW
ncbi:MAG: tetratricopeptide repeat protein [Holophagales bacterium]|nr:tetratricopeptide repeat protein [Holophagales bacterium]MYD22241.1 tetratricopeptide repeat protein [Holophagales bacterium]MYI34219.1 tetratricopeptide repeat protein [Holophagales bacterium]